MMHHHVYLLTHLTQKPYFLLKLQVYFRGTRVILENFSILLTIEYSIKTCIDRRTTLIARQFRYIYFPFKVGHLMLSDSLKCLKFKKKEICFQFNFHKGQRRNTIQFEKPILVDVLNNVRQLLINSLNAKVAIIQKPVYCCANQLTGFYMMVIWGLMS